MSLVVRLLGRPRLDHPNGDGYEFRSRKSWALLAYLLLDERPPSRAQLASLLFAEAADPLGALRWSLAEVRRGLGVGASVEGDPVVLEVPDDTVIDALVVLHGTWADAVRLPGLGSDLLEGIALRGAPAFESWILSEQRHLAAASEAILHEAAVGSMAHGAEDAAIGYAVRAAAMSPLDENHQALLIRLYRRAGDDAAAERQFALCADTFERELGVTPGPAVQAARRESRVDGAAPLDPASIAARVESGSAAVSAGAVETGVQTLREAVRMADGADGTSDTTHLRVRGRLLLAEALIHSLRGLDEEGVATLHEAEEIALTHDDLVAAAHARSELGYVDFLRARYDRAEVWLTGAGELAAESVPMQAKVAAYLGSVLSDRAAYPAATETLARSVDLSQTGGETRREAYARSMLGRLHLLRGDLDAATAQLDTSIALAERDHWLSFVPWPQALRGEVALHQGNPAAAAALLEQSFARACQLGDPCWEGIAARGLALVADADGDTARAFEVLADSRARCNRLADPYVWLDGYILDAQCALGRRHDHAGVREWIDALHDLASRTGMRELRIRALLHGAALGDEGAAAAAELLVADIDNPVLAELVGA